jgi:hypothetical protein
MSSLDWSVFSMLDEARRDITQIRAILTPDNLKKIKDGYELSLIVSRVCQSRPSDLSDLSDLVEEILTPEVLGKIQDEYQLSGLIRVLNWSMPIVDRLLKTPGVLDKIQDGDDIAELILALYHKRVELEGLVDQILTPEILRKIQNMEELLKVTHQLSLLSCRVTVERKSELIVKVLTTPPVADRFSLQDALDSPQLATPVVRTAVQELIESSRRWNDLKSAFVSAVVRATHQRFGVGLAAHAREPKRVRFEIDVAVPATTAMAFGGLGGGGSAGAADPVVEHSSGST